MEREKAQEAREFVGSLFGGKPEKSLVQLWSKQSKESKYLANLDAAADMAVGMGRDAYIGVSLVARNLGRKRRGMATDAAGIGGLWADIDVNGGPENQKGKAPSHDAAIELANVVLEPSILVNSGHGIQAWWLFPEPWVFKTISERERAAQVAAGWIATLKGQARERGFTIDSTQDLARLMRVPGTLNGKGGLDVPVTIVESRATRYEIEVLAEHATTAPAAQIAFAQSVDVDVTIDPNAQPPLDKLDTLRENSDAFDLTWRRQRAGKQWSASEYDLSLAAQAAQAGWTDQEITDLLVAGRRKHGDDLKRPDYYARTVRKVRTETREEEREEAREEALDQLSEIGADPDAVPDPDRVTALFTEAIGGGFVVREFVQSNLDPSNAVFRLVLSNGVEIPVGQIGYLRSFERFAERFAVVTGHNPKPISKPKWVNALNALFKIRQVRGADLTTTRSQVLGWLQNYVGAQLTDDHNEASERRDPFERDGYLWIAPRKFYDFVTRQERKRIAFGEIEEVLDRLGFEKHLKSYTIDGNRTTTTAYYRAPKGVLDEPVGENDVPDE